jgi:protein-tyrosine kinase
MTFEKQDKKQSTIVSLMADAAVESDENQYFKTGQSEVTGVIEKPRLNNEIVHIQGVLRNRNMLVAGGGLDQRSFDEYRRIKRPLLSNAFGKTSSLVDHGNLIFVTSSLPGEGKTYTAINLALSIAQEKDHTVLLIDCDIVRQGVSRMLGLEGKLGLADVLESDQYTVADVLLRSDIPDLTILPAGSPNEYVTELLACQRMTDVVSEIAARYDDRVIVFDGPPLLATPQSQVLVSLVGQVVFVIEMGKTPNSIVSEALQMIPEEKATGLVMNKHEGAAGHGGYYYGYYGQGDEKNN